ncbi:MAG: hypothetical protein EBU84_11115 [Actinobacteria bacterium]|nr:hypothetical protein [Actinomycetota bacterium]
MKRVLLALGLLAAVLSVPVQTNARKDLSPARALPNLTYRPLVFERYPLDFSAFDDASSDDDGPFNFNEPIGGYRPVNYLFGDERGGGMAPEMNHTFYGMELSTPVYAGISGVINLIQDNPQTPTPQCDSEIFISPDSPIQPLSYGLYFDHIIPSADLRADYEANGAVRVTPDTVIGTVGIREDGDCNPDNAGWLEIAIIQNYPYDWTNMDPGLGMPTHVAQWCPVLFMPEGASAPTMPNRPAVTDERFRPQIRRPDTRGPRIVQRTPALGARGVRKTSKITIRFNERVTITQREDARVSVTRLTAQPDLRAVSGTSGKIRLSPNGKTVTIDTDTLNLQNANMYAVRIDGFLFRDVAGNAFAGVNGLGDWNFSVGPTTVRLPSRTYRDVRSEIENQLHNIMVKFNRMAPESYTEYTTEQLNTEYALCSTTGFRDSIVHQDS